MPTGRRNPFPDYPVTRLQEKAVPTGPVLETSQIKQARDLVRQYASYWTEPRTEDGRAGPLFISVRGDYGVGKTFLLLDAISTLSQTLGEGANSTMLRFSCLETDAVTWYRTGIGPALEAASLSDVMAHVYAKAGELVADEARLTEGAVKRLQKEPRFIYSLVNQNLLNRTAVDQRLFRILGKDCEIAQEDVVKALAGLVWDQTASVATRWLAGHELSATELDLVRIPAAAGHETTVAAALTALASIHTFLRWPFALFIDELEHLVRYDTSQGGRRNITWLKRLLEDLSRSGVLVFIAGHFDAWEEWEANQDSPGRLSAQQQIRLWKLTAGDVDKIVRAWAGDSASLVFDTSEAQAVTDLTDGNMRRVLSLLRILFSATNGFQSPLAVDQVKSLAEQSGQKISLEDAKLRLHEILERRGLQVQSPAVVDRITFDLVGYEAGRPAILVELKHAALQEQQGASHFLSRVLSAQSVHPGVLGFFVVDGNIDQDALAVLGNPRVRIRVFDLTQRDVLTQLAAEVDKRLEKGHPPDVHRTIEDLAARQQSLLERIQAAQRAKDSELAQTLAAERRTVQKQLDRVMKAYEQLTDSVAKQVSAIEQQRLAEAREFQMRIDELTRVLKTERERSLVEPATQAPQPAAPDTKIHVTYTELTRPRRLWARLTYAFSLKVGVSLGISAAALLLWFFGPHYPSFRPFFTIGALLYVIVGLLSALWFFLSGVQRLNRYDDFSARMLRELYARSSDPATLLTADNILRSCLEEDGPIRGGERAREALLNAFPSVFEFVAHLNRDSASRAARR